MKPLTLIIISFLTLNCKGQNQEFVTYLSNFRSVELPLSIDRKTYGSVFYPNKKNHEIIEFLIKKFVCQNSTNCVVAPTEYRYDYGVKFILGNYHVVLVHKQKYEGTTSYDFDLSEVLLVVYSKQGEILSSQPISKDNDAWISSTQITKENIEVQQIKILEFNEPEMSCEIETKVYQVTQEGIIKNIHTAPIKKGVVVWDEQIEDFRLK
jgi:hypothetical protein